MQVLLLIAFGTAIIASITSPFWTPLLKRRLTNSARQKYQKKQERKAMRKQLKRERKGR